MKKIILLLILISITGCSTEDFTRTCKFVNNSKDLTEKQIMQVNYNNKDKLTNVIITKKYLAQGSNGKIALENLKESLQSYNNALLTKKGLKISISEDAEKEYIIKYYIDVSNAEKEVLEIFNLEKNSINFFNKMREKNIECQ